MHSEIVFPERNVKTFSLRWKWLGRSIKLAYLIAKRWIVCRYNVMEAKFPTVFNAVLGPTDSSDVALFQRSMRLWRSLAFVKYFAAGYDLQVFI